MHCYWGYALWCSEGCLMIALIGECIPRWVIPNDTTCKVHLLKMTLHLSIWQVYKRWKKLPHRAKVSTWHFRSSSRVQLQKKPCHFFLGFKSKDHCMIRPRKVEDCVAGANDPVSHDVVHEKAGWSEATRRKWLVYSCKLYIGSVDSK